MKCPKCGYISFDYNLACPKCDRDISAEQAKLNIPAFEPHPLFLLGALTGDADESHVGLRFDSVAVFGEPTTEVDLAQPDATPEGTGEFSFEVSEEEAVSLDEEGLGDMEEAGDIDFGGFGDVGIAEEEPVTDLLGEEAADEDIFLKEEKLPPKQSAAAPVSGEAEMEDEGLTLDLGELADEEERIEEEEGEYVETGAEDLTQELRKISFEKVVEDKEGEFEGLDDFGATPTPGFKFMEMNYDELPSQKTSTQAGKGSDLADSMREHDTEEAEEIQLDLDEISLDEEPPTSAPVSPPGDNLEETGLDLEALEAVESALPEEEEVPDKEEIQLSLDDLKINDTGELEIGRDIPAKEPAEEEALEELSLEESFEADQLASTVSLEYEELELEEPATELGITAEEKEGFEETPIELDEITLTEVPPSKRGNKGRDDLPADLENLDLELDLDENNDKSK